MTETKFGALADVRVLDLTQALAGPYATMMLADQGAEVIKVETPRGDGARGTGPFRADDAAKTHGGYFQSINRNKQSIVLNLKEAAGQAALLKLVETADVLVENYRHGVMEGFGLAYERLREANPKLVYACLRGYGDARSGASPYKDWPAFDVVAQATGGLANITGATPGQPTKVGPGVGDIFPATYLAFGILAALRHADKTGEGQFLDIGMSDAVLSLSERIVYQYSSTGHVPGIEGNHHPMLAPFGYFPAKDGMVAIAAPGPAFFARVAEALDAQHLLEDDRFSTFKALSANLPALRDAFAEVTIGFTKQELQDRLGGEVPFGPLNSVDAIFEDPHFAAREMLCEVEQPGSADPLTVANTPLKLSATPGGVKRRAPYLGEDTHTVLAAAGLPEDEIAAMLAEGAAVQYEQED